MYCIRDRVQNVDSLALKLILSDIWLCVVVVVVGVKGVIEAVDLRGAILYIFTARFYG